MYKFISNFCFEDYLDFGFHCGTLKLLEGH